MLTARGHDAEGEFGFGACLQLFERILAEPARRERVLVGAAELSLPLLGAAEAAPRPRAALRPALIGSSGSCMACTG